MEFPTHFHHYLKANTLVRIKGGKSRDTFLNIWMVEVDNRIFARSWNKSHKSWFTEFLTSGCGQIKYGRNIINVKGVKLDNNDPLNTLIDKEYLNKYNQKENLKYAEGISQPEYADYTMEFLYDGDE
ncbi:DUF2255 family protein [Maribacter polysiphoniae]|uniref:DUF2255 family protein n=1 Tax=Maribacter polysiphoniae TaxID=429344 RepID=A0A316DTS2_9FLAO|nr:DUF2255 family protein [Maribacter polysiphoniae]MBD1262603.1 DUF2255 family protein [Maribacter polysiphoniae]PWK21196.1 uncharacterized protein DUF2255 [Maribacter polysiphoniae]